MIDSRDFFVVSSQAAGEHIRVRQRVGERLASVADERTRAPVLFVHGATYPGVMFDVPGVSWMQAVAAQGRAAYALDVRGYGGSTRPDSMGQPAADGVPCCHAESAAGDIADVVAAIQARSGAEQVDIVGWSWGTLTSGLYASCQPAALRRLVLFAPVYGARNPHWLAQLAEPDNPDVMRAVGAWRSESRAQAGARWAAQIQADDPQTWRDAAVLDAWYDAMLADEPASAPPDAVQAPNGVLEDLWAVFNGRARYNAGAINVPTLVIRGSCDPTATREDALGLLDSLGSAHKQYTEIGHATHFALLEHRRHALIDQVGAFLDAAWP